MPKLFARDAGRETRAIDFHARIDHAELAKNRRVRADGETSDDAASAPHPSTSPPATGELVLVVATETGRAVDVELGLTEAHAGVAPEAVFVRHAPRVRRCGRLWGDSSTAPSYSGKRVARPARRS